MDREKLKEYAIDYSTYTDSDDYDVAICDAIKDGAEWLQSQPLVDRLTEEESIRIKAYYEQHKNLEHYGKTCADRKAGLRLKIMFEQIFGKEMFEK